MMPITKPSASTTNSSDRRCPIRIRSASASVVLQGTATIWPVITSRTVGSMVLPVSRFGRSASHMNNAQRQADIPRKINIVCRLAVPHQRRLSKGQSSRIVPNVRILTLGRRPPADTKRSSPDHTQVVGFERKVAELARVQTKVQERRNSYEFRDEQHSHVVSYERKAS